MSIMGRHHRSVPDPISYIVVEEISSVLRIYSQPFLFYASLRLGAVLSWVKGGKKRVVAYASRSLNPQEKELLALKDGGRCDCSLNGYASTIHTAAPK
ncbi:unnamed protein product [Merluccius merluccius]